MVGLWFLFCYLSCSWAAILYVSKNNDAFNLASILSFSKYGELFYDCLSTFYPGFYFVYFQVWRAFLRLYSVFQSLIQKCAAVIRILFFNSFFQLEFLVLPFSTFKKSNMFLIRYCVDNMQEVQSLFTAKNQYRKFKTNIPRKVIERPQSQFPYS